MAPRFLQGVQHTLPQGRKKPAACLRTTVQKAHTAAILLHSPRWINRGHQTDLIISSVIRLPKAYIPLKSRVNTTLAVFLAQLLIALPFSLQFALDLSNRNYYKIETSETVCRACASQRLKRVGEGSP